MGGRELKILLTRVLVLPQKKNCAWLVTAVLVKMPFHWSQETILTMREVDSHVQCHSSAQFLACIYKSLFIEQNAHRPATVTCTSQKAGRKHDTRNDQIRNHSLIIGSSGVQNTRCHIRKPYMHITKHCTRTFCWSSMQYHSLLSRPGPLMEPVLQYVQQEHGFGWGQVWICSGQPCSDIWNTH